MVHSRKRNQYILDFCASGLLDLAKLRQYQFESRSIERNINPYFKNVLLSDGQLTNISRLFLLLSARTMSPERRISLFGKEHNMRIHFCFTAAAWRCYRCCPNSFYVRLPRYRLWCGYPWCLWCHFHWSGWHEELWRSSWLRRDSWRMLDDVNLLQIVTRRLK